MAKKALKLFFMIALGQNSITNVSKIPGTFQGSLTYFYIPWFRQDFHDKWSSIFYYNIGDLTGYIKYMRLSQIVIIIIVFLPKRRWCIWFSSVSQPFLEDGSNNSEIEKGAHLNLNHIDEDRIQVMNPRNKRTELQGVNYMDKTKSLNM